MQMEVAMNSSQSVLRPLYATEASSSEEIFGRLPRRTQTLHPVASGQALALGLLLGFSMMSGSQANLLSSQLGTVTSSTVSGWYDFDLGSDLEDSESNTDFEVDSPNWLEQTINELKARQFTRLHDPRHSAG